MQRPLDGLQVLDFSRLLPGPYCTRLLNDLGALVIKVEDTETGDPGRYLPPFRQGVSALFALLNRNKQSVALDLKSLAGQAIAGELAAASDVVVEGFRPGVATRLGIDFEALSKRNQRLVYCSISGYGQQGPLRDLPGHDLTYAAMSGLLEALSPGAPRVPGVQLVDSAGALLAVVRILAALRAVDGGPQFLDVSLVDAARALMPGAIAEVRAGPSKERSIMDLLRGSARNNLYRCSDGRWLAVTPLEEPFWLRLCTVLREEGAIGPEDVPTTVSLHHTFRRRSCAEWYALLSKAGVPCAPLQSVQEGTGPGWAVDAPALQQQIGWEEASGPALGQHTAAWLERLGYSPQERAALRDQGVIRLAGDPPES